jgi:hypothetical protein
MESTRAVFVASRLSRRDDRRIPTTMPRRTSSFAGVAVLVLAVTARPQEEGWPFRPGPEPEDEASLVFHLRGLNETVSGQTGFVRLSADGNSFVRGDGQPIRFWAIGSDIYRESPEAMDAHCRFLARRGVNMVRLHATVANTEEGAAISDVNEKEIAGIFRFIKAAKENGIYLTISPYYAHHPTPASWGLDGFRTDQQPWGAIFIDARMQAGYRAWTRALYSRVNPHTGLAIKDDPTVAILQIHNEDSLFFWTMQALPEPQAATLAARFAEWLQAKYGTLEKAVAAWDRHAEEGDDPTGGTLKLLPTWHLTQDWQGGIARRVRDQTEFLARHQRQFYADMGKYLRDELGCKQLLNATNWRTANDARLKDIERWTYAALDIDAENEYYGSDYQHIGENNGYRIDPGHYFVDESCLKKPLELPVHFKQQVGHPFLVTETSWKNPNLYQAEGPLLVAAYQSLNGVDAVFWFSADAPTWTLDARRMFWPVDDSYAINKWSVSYPVFIGMFPANALLFRKGYLAEGRVVVHEERSLDELWDRKPALIDDNEIQGKPYDATNELGRARLDDGRVSRAAFLIGRVEAVHGGDPARTTVGDMHGAIDPLNHTLRSLRAGLVWDYRNGLVTVSAEKAQGVAGFLKSAGPDFRMSAVRIRSEMDYAAVSVVALDDRPLDESRRVLIQVGTTMRPKGWKDEPAEVEFEKTTIAGRRIVSTGEPPWMIAPTEGIVSIVNPHLRRAVQVAPNLTKARDLEPQRDGESIAVTLPCDAMYVVLTP